MPFIPAANCVLVEVLGQQSGQPCEFTFAALKTGYVEADLVDLAGTVDGWYNTALLNRLAPDVIYEGVTVRGLAEEEDLRYDLTEPLPGTASGTESFPAQVALCVTKRSGLTGRSARGRLYLWGVNSVYRLDDRHITVAAVTIYQNAFDALEIAVADAGWAIVILSYRHDGAPRSAAQITLLDHFQVRDNRLDTQRRRLGVS